MIRQEKCKETFARFGPALQPANRISAERTGAHRNNGGLEMRFGAPFV
jgi:hypothetical protein